MPSYENRRKITKQRACSIQEDSDYSLDSRFFWFPWVHQFRGAYLYIHASDIRPSFRISNLSKIALNIVADLEMGIKIVLW